MVKPDPLLRHWHNDTYLGFDFGHKKIGVAVGQQTTATASPLETIRSIRQTPNWQRLDQLIQQWQPCGLVVGISLQQNGEDNPVTPKMRKFCQQLQQRYQLPVHIMDETLTTYEAKQLLFDELHVSARRLWEVQDQLAAQLILQTWLNHTYCSNFNPASQ